MCQHHRAGPPVVAARQRPPDRLQRRLPAFGAVDPVRELSGRGPLAGGQESRNRERHKLRRGLFGRELLAGDLDEAQRLVGQTRQFGFVVERCGRRIQSVVVIVYELAVLVHPHPTDVHRLGVVVGRADHGHIGFGRRLDEIAGQYLPQHQMRVGATETEAGHPGDRLAAVARPVGDGVGDLEVFLVEVDVRVGTGVVDRRRDLVVLERQRHLGQAGRTGRRFQMSHIGFHCTQQRRPVVGAAPADDPAQRVGLDRVAEDGARAVRFDVVDRPRVDAGVLVRLAQHRFLRIGIGGQQTVGASVVVDRTAGDHRQDVVTVAAGVFETLEHQHAAAL